MKRTTTTSHKITLTREDLIDLIRDAFDIPKAVGITFYPSSLDDFAVALWGAEEPNTVHLGGCAASEKSFLDSLRNTQKVRAQAWACAAPVPLAQNLAFEGTF